jgi:hypothetical protein
MQENTVVRTSKNTWHKNKKTLMLLVGTILLMVTISVIYIIIFPNL